MTEFAGSGQFSDMQGAHDWRGLASAQTDIRPSPLFAGRDLPELLRSAVLLGEIEARTMGHEIPRVEELHQGIIRLSSRQDGPKAMLVGGFHGNEPCGVATNLTLAQELVSGSRRLMRGAVTLAFGNLAAIKANVRPLGDGDANRLFKDRIKHAVSPELVVRVADIKAQVQVGTYCLDLHSLSSASPPMGFCGEGRERDARLLPVKKIVVFDRQFQKHVVGSFVGWAVNRGAAAGLVVECGQHDDPNSIVVAQDNARAFLDSVGITSPTTSPLVRYDDKEFFRVIEYDPKPELREGETAHFQFERLRHGFEEVRSGEFIGRYTICRGESIVRQEDRFLKNAGFLIMPAAAQNLSDSGNYFIAQSYIPD